MHSQNSARKFQSLLQVNHIAHHPSHIIHHPSHVTHHTLPIIHHPLSITSCCRRSLCQKTRRIFLQKICVSAGACAIVRYCCCCCCCRRRRLRRRCCCCCFSSAHTITQPPLNPSTPDTTCAANAASRTLGACAAASRIWRRSENSTPRIWYASRVERNV